jgi:DNA-binding MarR family transcriptional regulator
MRGEILRALLNDAPLSASDIAKTIRIERKRLTLTLTRLEQEGFIKEHGGTYTIT